MGTLSGWSLLRTVDDFETDCELDSVLWREYNMDVIMSTFRMVAIST